MGRSYLPAKRSLDSSQKLHRVSSLQTVQGGVFTRTLSPPTLTPLDKPKHHSRALAPKERGLRRCSAEPYISLERSNPSS